MSTGAGQRFMVIPLTLEPQRLLLAAFWLMLASGFFVIVEPAPFDLVFAAVMVLFILSGMRTSIVMAPLIIFLLLYNLGGFVSFLEVSSEYKANLFVITSVYMAAMAVVIAIAISTTPLETYGAIRAGWIVGGTIASVLALMGYFNIAGTGGFLSLHGRATGTFKDPNVFSTFIVPPAVFLIHGFMMGTQRRWLLAAPALMLILAAIFLAFSRGAWMNVLLATGLVVIMTFVTTPSQGLRTRIIVLSVLGALGLAAMLAVLLSFDDIRQLFLDRATLVKDYDSGETGRFGNQLRSIGILLERPFGFGPTFFRKIFGADPHNVYLNAFSSYGWLGGLSYPLLILSTWIAGWKAMTIPSPYQGAAIACFCPFFATAVQGVQIDTDHWRHFYVLLGLTWGLFAAALAHVPETGARVRSSA